MMNKCRFFLVDDDPACCRMLGTIIEQSELGTVIDIKHSGIGVVDSILNANPDIVILDLLLPGMDGISIVAELRAKGFCNGIIMISQVEKKHMIAQAYQMGVEFYINKPINKIEVLSVITNVLYTQKLKFSLKVVHDSINALVIPQYISNPAPKQPFELKHCALEILSDMGISGEPGSYDLVRIAEFLWDNKLSKNEPLRLRNIFEGISTPGKNTPKDIKAIEQRVRRAVKQAMTNISALGLEDFQNPIFERYAHRFFDFNEIRRKMRELSGKETSNKAKIDLRKFINAFLIEIRSRKEIS